MTRVCCRTLAGLIAVGVWAGPPMTALAQDNRPRTPAAFTADVEVERHLVDATGTIVQRGPLVRYRLSYRADPHDPETEIRFRATPPFPGRGPLPDPAAGYRVVVSRRQGIRMFDPEGRAVQSPAGGGGLLRLAEAASPDGQRAEPTLPRAADGRRRDWRVRYGGPAGRVDGRDRYVRVDDRLVEEAFIDPDTALPLEFRMLHEGRLLFRSSLSYGTLPDGRFFRRVQRDEVPTGPHDESRQVTVTTMTPVAGGGR